MNVIKGVANGSSKILGLAKFQSNFTGLAVSFFEQLCASRSLVFYMKVSNTLKSRSRNLKSQNVSGSQRKTLVSPSRKVSQESFFAFWKQKMMIAKYRCTQMYTGTRKYLMRLSEPFSPSKKS